MSSKRLTRKEIVQQDKIQKTLATSSSWAVHHLALLGGGLAAVVLILLGIYLFQQYQAGRDVDAQTAFAEALRTYHASVQDPAAPQPETPPVGPVFKSEAERQQAALEAFRKVAEEYPGGTVGSLSRYYVALTEAEGGNVEAARKGLADVIASAESLEIKNLARNALAQIEISEGNHAEAARLLGEILAEPTPNFPQQIVLMRQAQSYEATGDTANALAAYRKIISDFPGNEQASLAESRVKVLEP